MSRIFVQPALLALLAALPVCIWLNWRARRRGRQALGMLGDGGRIKTQIVNRGRPVGRGAACTLTLILLTIAAAGPRWGEGAPPPIMPGCDIVLAVDLSRSMLARDALPNRVERGKAALSDFVRAVEQHGGHRIGVVAFAGNAQIVCPLTNDYDHVRAKIQDLTADPLPSALESPGISGTRIGAGLTAAVATHDLAARGAQMIVLVSDGDDPTQDDEWRDGSTAARAAGIPIFVVGIGDPDRESPIAYNGALLKFQGRGVTSRLHKDLLAEIAANTSGKLISAGVAKPDLTAFERDTVDRFPTREQLAGSLPQPTPRQIWFLLGALILLLALTATNEVGRLARRMLRLAAPVTILLLLGAASVPDLELRRGIEALDAGQAEAALAHFRVAAERTTDPGLVAFNEGIALYRLGQYRDAELHFRWSLSDAEGSRRGQALYNLGCSLLQSSGARQRQPLEDAIAAFERSLECAELELEVRAHARDNLLLAKRLLAQLPKPSPSPGETPDSNDEAKLPPPGSHGDERLPGDRERGGISKSGEPTTDGPPDGAARATDRTTPGKGYLPPLPDDDGLKPLTAEDARAHFEQATARIAAARETTLRQRAAAPSSQFPDW